MNEMISPDKGEQLVGAAVNTESDGPDTISATELTVGLNQGTAGKGRPTSDLPPDAHKPLPSEQLDTMRTVMCAAIERRSVPDIEDIFAQAWRLLTSAQVSELRHKREKNIKRQYASWKIELSVERLRAQWLVDTGKATLRFIRPKDTKIGAPIDLITLDAPGRPPRIGIDRKKSQQLQALARLSEEQFKTVLADKSMPTLSHIIKLYATPKPGHGISVLGMKGRKRVLPLSAIRADERAQPRAALQTDRVAEYAEDMRRGAKFPPLMVFEDSEGVFWLADGFHRYGAAVQVKLEAIECEVRSGGLRDAILCGCGANAAHGIRRTIEDKRRAVTCLLKDAEWGKWSDRKIAEQCKVSHTFVGKIREELKSADTGNVASMERTFTHPKTGKPTKMKTGNIGGGEPKPAANDTPDDVAQPDKPAPADDDALAQDLAPASKRDDAPPTAPDQPTSTPEEAAAERKALYARNEQTAPDGDADLPVNLEPRRKRLSLDEKLGNLIFLVEHQINALVPEVRAAGRLPELYRRVRNLVDRLEAQAVVDANLDESENGAEPAAVDRATPAQEQMSPTPKSPDPPPAA